jgi:hypothetical protein
MPEFRVGFSVWARTRQRLKAFVDASLTLSLSDTLIRIARTNCSCDLPTQNHLAKMFDVYAVVGLRCACGKRSSNATGTCLHV